MDSYEPLGVLAAALYGDVYKLRHRATGDVVALKRMDLQAAARRRTKDTNRPIEEDLFTEVQTNLTLRRLGGHRHIVALRDCFADDSSVSLVTDFCAQGELLDVVNARGALLPVEDALRYFHQIVQGVAFLHTHGIAHRDLSLENVLVDEFDCCKLSDFGMASTATRLRATGIGKIHYMAPEACREGDDAPERFYNPFHADMWSLGVILITLLTGQYPFDRALDSDAHFQLVSTLGVEALLEVCGFDMDGYDDVVDILRWLLAVEPSSRATAAEVLAHECFEDFTAVVNLDLSMEMDLSEDLEKTTIPVDYDEEEKEEEQPEDDAVGARPVIVSMPPIDTRAKPSVTYVRPSASARPSAAALKEQRSLAIAPTTSAAVARSLRRLRCRKKCALRGVLDGVFRRKKARTSMVPSRA